MMHVVTVNGAYYQPAGRMVFYQNGIYIGESHLESQNVIVEVYSAHKGYEGADRVINFNLFHSQIGRIDLQYMSEDNICLLYTSPSPRD